MNEQEKERKAFFSRWLEKLQQESWQLELIISGLALFGVYNSRHVVIDIDMAAEMSFTPVLRFVSVLFAVGWKIFFINLLIHVILRSLWIGAIGLRYISADIEYDELNYSEVFTKYLRRKVGDYDDFIERLERICSVLFSYTFLLFLFFLSTLCFFMGFTIPLVTMDALGIDIGENEIYIGLFALPYLLFGLIVFIDFITLGGIKRIKDNRVSKIYMPIYRFYSTITLSFLYRPLLYNFIDEKYTRRLFFLSLPYIFVIAFGNRMFSDNPIPHIPNQSVENGFTISDRYYDDLSMQRLGYISDDNIKENKSLAPIRLSAYAMEKPYASIFVKHTKALNEILEKGYGVSPIYKSGWQFTLFENQNDYKKVAKDSLREKLAEDFDTRRETFYKEYKLLRDSLRSNKVPDDLKYFVEQQRDSVRKIRRDLLVEKRKALKDFDLDKEKNILQAIQNLIDVSIDGVDYNDSLTCYFATHPNNMEPGIRCNFSVENLSSGMHDMKIDKIYKYDSDDDSLRTYTYLLPFLKQF